MAIWPILLAVGCGPRVNPSSEGCGLKRVVVVVGVWLSLAMAGCGQGGKALVPAPLGERAALERLAKSYTHVSDYRYTVSPLSLTGGERKKFVVEVFTRAGYDYSATLDRMAHGLDAGNQLHLDLAELVLMPHQRPKFPTDPADIYSAEELMDVSAVERALNRR